MKIPDDLPFLEFTHIDHFRRWLAENHASSPGLWVKLPEHGDGVAGGFYTAAVGEAIRYGWIDGPKIPLDASSSLLRFARRRRGSSWLERDRIKATSFIWHGWMEPAGLTAVQLARADGRWDTTDASTSDEPIPLDLQVALDAKPGATAFFEALNTAQQAMILDRIQAAKLSANREHLIAKYVGKCGRGDKIH